MGFAHIEENEQRLTGCCRQDPLIKPSQLFLQTPGVAREMKLLKAAARLGTSFCCGIKPIDSSSAQSQITRTSEPINYVDAA
jgi:hypothetical protein